MSKSIKFEWPDNVSFEDAAITDFLGLDRALQIMVFKALIKVAANPYPRPKGYGKPLGKDLKTFMKIKLRDSGVRIIYRLVPPDSDHMRVIVIGLRAEGEVYREALRRI